MPENNGPRRGTHGQSRKGTVMEKERLYYLDAARGLAILLVVLGHIWETDQPVPVLIYSFHVPLFFVISGILISYTGQEHRTARQLVVSRIWGLLVPYLFFEAIFVAIFGLRNHFDFSSQHAHIYDSLLLSPLNVPMWFLPTLFLTEFFLIFLVRAIQSKKYAAMICLILYLLPFAAEIRHILPDAVLRCFSSLGFLAIGYFGADFFREKNPPLYFLLPIAVASCLLALLNGKTGIYKLTFHNPVLFTVCALAGSCCTIFLLKKCTPTGKAQAASASDSSGKKSYRCTLPLELAGRNSLTILGLHIIVLRILQEIFGLNTDSVIGGLTALAGICLLLTPVCIFLNRFLPSLIGKRR